MKTVQIFFIFFIFLLSFFPMKVSAVNEPTTCSGEVIDLGVEKKLISPSQLSRPGICGQKPTKIVMHTTWGHDTAEGLWEYFETKPEGRYASTQFVVGKDGKVLQMLETLSDKVEIGWAVSYFNDDSVSIEIGRNGNFNTRDEVPKVQYDATVKLVQALMQAYDIPVGNIEYTAINNTNDPSAGGPIAKSSLGIFGHYQLSPDDRSDPGQGFLRDFREDLKILGPEGNNDDNNNNGSSNRYISQKCITQVGTPLEPSPGPLGCTGGSEDNIFGGGPAGPCQAPPSVNYTSSEEYEDAIFQKWGISVNLPLHQMQNAWKEFHEIDCTGLLQDIRGSIISSWGEGWSEQFSCAGDPGVNLYISTQFQGEWVETHLTHELTHLWQKCSSRGEANQLENNAAYDIEGGITHYSRTTCGFGSNKYNEDHAESISLFLNPSSGETTCAQTNVNPFSNGGFPKHKEVAEKGVGKK